MGTGQRTGERIYPPMRFRMRITERATWNMALFRATRRLVPQSDTFAKPRTAVDARVRERSESQSRRRKGSQSKTRCQTKAKPRTAIWRSEADRGSIAPGQESPAALRISTRLDLDRFAPMRRGSERRGENPSRAPVYSERSLATHSRRRVSTSGTT